MFSEKLSPPSGILVFMATPHRTCPHTPAHVPAARTAAGEPVDLTIGLTLLGAAFDGCEPCQRKHTEALLDGAPDVIAHLAGMSFTALEFMLRPLQDLFGDCGSALAGSAVLSGPTQEVFASFAEDNPAAAEGKVRALNRDEQEVLLAEAVNSLITAKASLARRD